MNNRGFTLIELIIVVTIIGILAMIAVPAYVGQQRSATRSEAIKGLEALRLFEEEFFAEGAVYTGTLGTAGSSEATRDANVTAIQAILPGFQPGNGANYSFMVTQNEDMNGAAQTPCFHARATGVTGSRVVGDVFDVDCNYNKNY